MKKILLVTGMLLSTSVLFAQNEEENDNEKPNGFKKENIFIGGGINIGGGSGSFQFGLTPEVGYSITKWLDAGVLFIANYQTQNDVYHRDPFTGVSTGPFKVKNFNYGTGAVVRIWPLNFLHLTAQPEFNWIKSNVTYLPTGEKGSDTYRSTSFLVGIGYGSRNIGNNYQYITIVKDLLNDEYSPYRDPSGRSSFAIKAGIGFYLKASRK